MITFKRVSELEDILMQILWAAAKTEAQTDMLMDYEYQRGEGNWTKVQVMDALLCVDEQFKKLA